MATFLIIFSPRGRAGPEAFWKSWLWEEECEKGCGSWKRFFGGFKMGLKVGLKVDLKDRLKFPNEGNRKKYKSFIFVESH